MGLREGYSVVSAIVTDDMAAAIQREAKRRRLSVAQWLALMIRQSMADAPTSVVKSERHGKHVRVTIPKADAQRLYLSGGEHVAVTVQKPR